LALDVCSRAVIYLDSAFSAICEMFSTAREFEDAYGDKSEIDFSVCASYVTTHTMRHSLIHHRQRSPQTPSIRPNPLTNPTTSDTHTKAEAAIASHVTKNPTTFPRSLN